MPFSPKAQELQICSKQASFDKLHDKLHHLLEKDVIIGENKDHLYEMSIPTNKLATYFGDDKPTSRSVGRWIGIGFACVKHCASGA